MASWDKWDLVWKKRAEAPPGKPLPNAPDITYEVESWEIPGETPLEVRRCKRKGHPIGEWSSPWQVKKTAIMLHVTAGFDNLAYLMGGKGNVSVHFIVCRAGNVWGLVPTELTAWHGNEDVPTSVGIEVENVGPLQKVGNEIRLFGKKSVYCTADETAGYYECHWQQRPYIKYWAAFTEEQYRSLARLLKAISHRHQIPRVVQPEPQRYDPIPKDKRPKVKGLVSHVQYNPDNRADIGGVIDWDKLLRYAEYEIGDLLSPPEYRPPANPTPLPGGPDAPAPSGSGSAAPSGGGSAAPSGGGSAAPSGGGPAAPSGGGSAAPSGGGANPPEPTAPASTTQTMVALPAPVRVSDETVRVAIGSRGGRVAFTVRKPGEPLPTAPKPGDLPPPQADGKRDEFVRAALNFVGCPYKAGGTKPAEGVDGVGLVTLCLQRIGLLKDSKEPLDAEALAHLWPMSSGSADEVPPGVLPGDLAWFGTGDHDTHPAQLPLINLGGGRVLGPVPGGKDGGAVQIVHVKDVPEKFVGWQHLDDLGVVTQQTAHPGDQPPGTKLSGALLPLAPADRYDALKAIVEKKGGSWLADKNKVNLVGVKEMHDRCQITPEPDGFNDTLYAAFLDDDGHKCCLELRASLNPGTDTEKKETWQLQEGTFKFKLGAGDGTGDVKALQPDGNIQGWFDKEGLGAPRGNDLVKPGPIKIDPLPQPPQTHPDHPDHPDKPGNTPTPPPDPSKPIDRTTGDWESVIDQDGEVPSEVIEQIKAARARYPAITPKPAPQGKKYLSNPRVFVNPDQSHRAWSQGTVQAKINSAQKKTDRFLFTAFKTLLGREGGTSDFNLWDSQIVTWGMGFGGLGGLASLLNYLQGDAAAKNELHNIGVWWDPGKGRYHIVDVEQKKVLSSQPKGKSFNHSPPLTYWNGADDLVSAFVGLGVSPGLRSAVLEANVKAYKSISGAFDGADALESQAAFNFISHLHHWLPGYARGCIAAAQSAGCGDDLSIVTHAAKRFVAKANELNKNGGFTKDWRSLMHVFWNQMKGDGLAVPDASTVDFDAGV